MKKKFKIICFDIDNVICETKGNYYKYSKPDKSAIKIINSLHDIDNALLMLEKNDLPLKKIGKIIRKITVNFESKIPIEKIFLFFGIEKVKEKLLLYLND